jgi:hypothetical protein
MAEEYLLSKNDFGSSIQKSFKNMYNDTEFADVTLACADDQQIKAHKIILSGSSDFFRKILSKNPHPSPLLYLAGLALEELQAVVQFIYLGEARVAGGRVPAFLEAARQLGVEGLLGEGGKPGGEVELVSQRTVPDKQMEEGHEDNKEDEIKNILTESFEEDVEINGAISSINNLPGTLSCDICGLITTAMTSNNRRMVIKRHKEKVHGKTDEASQKASTIADHIVVKEVEDIEIVDEVEEKVQDLTALVTKLEEKENEGKVVADGCEICGFSTAASSEQNRRMVMRRHARVHTGERDACRFCSKTFIQKHTMKQHVERNHATELQQETVI